MKNAGFLKNLNQSFFIYFNYNIISEKGKPPHQNL